VGRWLGASTRLSACLVFERSALTTADFTQTLKLHCITALNTTGYFSDYCDGRGIRCTGSLPVIRCLGVIVFGRYAEHSSKLPRPLVWCARTCPKTLQQSFLWLCLSHCGANWPSLPMNSYRRQQAIVRSTRRDDHPAAQTYIWLCMWRSKIYTYKL